MERGKRIVIVSHCLLNSNSKIDGLSQYAGVFKEFVDIIGKNDVGIIQLPCPEILVYGMRRWGHTKEQFDTLSYRKSCREMLSPIIDQIYAYRSIGYEIIGVIGVDGSPSCGVDITCSSKEWFGSLSTHESIEQIESSVDMIDGEGIFMEEFKNILKSINIEIPFIGINEENVFESLDKLEDFLESK